MKQLEPNSNHAASPVSWTALICCRISDKKQLKGSGLDSQEHRCREHADIHGYPVEAVFTETVSGGKSLLDRPDIVQLLAHLDRNKNSGKNYVVIFDDHKRFAREAEYHLILRRLLRERGVRVEFLNFRPEESPEGKFMELMLAGQAQLEREQNARQSKQKSIARLELGYAVQSIPPIGYRYVQARGGGKELVRDEPLASIVTEALNGFATGRFSSEAELTRFLESQPEFPKDLPGGGIRQYKVVRMLRKKLYAGYVGMPKWGVPYREGVHEPLVSKANFARIQDRLDGRVYAAARKDLHHDFPLRGAVDCVSCGVPLTAAWSTGKTKRHPYYRCRTKSCDQYGKSIRKEVIEDQFVELLSSVQPNGKLLGIAQMMFEDYWAMQKDIAASKLSALRKQLSAYEKQIEALVDKIVTATNPRIEKACEDRIQGLEEDKCVVREQMEQLSKPRTPKRDLFELAVQFLASPCYLWKTDRLDLQRLVLKLAFPAHLSYCREGGFLEPQISLPFSVLGKNKAFREKWCREGELNSRPHHYQ
ncbi:MAG: recombinase family protein [Henriciella sp.]|nr:recombinase family protein [Henriciella sp.]